MKKDRSRKSALTTVSSFSHISKCVLSLVYTRLALMSMWLHFQKFHIVLMNQLKLSIVMLALYCINMIKSLPADFYKKKVSCLMMTSLCSFSGWWGAGGINGEWRRPVWWETGGVSLQTNGPSGNHGTETHLPQAHTSMTWVVDALFVLLIFVIILQGT